MPCPRAETRRGRDNGQGTGDKGQGTRDKGQGKRERRRPMKLNPYLAFNGQCREAFEFYEKALGGKIAFIQTIGETPMASSMPADSHGRVMHVTLQVGDQVLQGSDTPDGQSTTPAGFTIAVHFDDAAEGERV